MRFKVASRVRGLSDEAFREAFGTEEQCRAALLLSTEGLAPRLRTRDATLNLITVTPSYGTH